MKKISLILAALLVSASAFAANTAVLTWAPPTTYSDGSGPIVDAITYNIYQGVQGVAKVKVGTPVSGNTVTISSGLANATTYCWHVTAVNAGQESVPSNEACKTFPAVPTNAPTGLRVD